MARKVAVIGVGSTAYTSAKKETRERTELGTISVKAALEHIGRGLSIEDIEAVFFATVNSFEGIQRPDRSMECFGQTYGTPVYMVNTGGTAGGSAFKDAYHSVAAGFYDLAICYGSSTFSATVEAQQILNSASPPMIEKPCGAGAIHMAAYYLTRYMHDHGATAEDWAMVAAKAHKHAVNNPCAHLRKGYTAKEILESPMVCSPIHLLEVCGVSSGACCLIIASEGKARELSDTPVWIKAVGSITDTFLVGYKNFAGFPTLKKLAKKVYQEAGIKKPLMDIDYAETFNPIAGFELLHYDALGFCEEGQAPNLLREGATDMGGELPVNLSGSTLCTNSGIAASVTRHADVCLQLMGRTGNVSQVKNARVGLAHSWGGNMGQNHTLAILSRD